MKILFLLILMTYRTLSHSQRSFTGRFMRGTCDERVFRRDEFPRRFRRSRKEEFEKTNRRRGWGRAAVTYRLNATNTARIDREESFFLTKGLGA